MKNSVEDISSALLPLIPRQISSAYTYFFESVSGKSYVYMLKRIGARTDTCGRPLMTHLRRLICSPAWRIKLHLLINSMMNKTMVLFGSRRSTFSFRPVCQTVSYAAVKSTRTLVEKTSFGYQEGVNSRVVDR